MIKEALAQLPSLYATDSEKGDLSAVYLFTPDAQMTWVLWEYDPETKTAFGLCDLGMGFPEIGYVSVEDIEYVRGGLKLPVEVDKSITTRFQGYGNCGIDVPSWMRK